MDGKGTLDVFIAGVVAIGLVTAFGLHAANLATLTKQAGSSGSQLLGTAETGNVSGG
jgi:hypothetical protein